MGLFDLINPLSPIKLTKKILDGDDMDLEEFGENCYQNHIGREAFL